MKRKNSITTLVQGIEVVLSRCRASLTAKEIELLENAIDLLEEIGENQNVHEDRFLILVLIVQLTKVITHPGVLEKLQIAFDHLQKLL
jgi:hypothetical protein